MKIGRQVLVGCGVVGALVAFLVGGRALRSGRRESLPPPAAAAPGKQGGPNGEGPTVEQVGNASWYGPAFDGNETANGETFDQTKLTAAHRTLPFGTKAVVTNLETGKSVQVRINDRGPYVKGRKIDLSRAAARQIGMSKDGVAKVKIETRRGRKPTATAVHPTSKSSAASAGVTRNGTPAGSAQ